MAKKPLPPRRTGGTTGPAASGATAPAQSEAVGKFDKFGAFALALPTTLLALVTLVVGVGYTQANHDIGFLGFPKKNKLSWEGGSEAVVRSGGGEAQITGFEQTNYLGRSSDGDVDVAVLNVGRDNGVNMGDVFTLKTENPDVRLEFIVFDVQATTSRAYILLGQNTENKKRTVSLKASELEKFCGAATNIGVKRDWKDQIIRRYVETRSVAQ